AGRLLRDPGLPGEGEGVLVGVEEAAVAEDLLADNSVPEGARVVEKAAAPTGQQHQPQGQEQQRLWTGEAFHVSGTRSAVEPETRGSSTRYSTSSSGAIQKNRCEPIWNRFWMSAGRSSARYASTPQMTSRRSPRCAIPAATGMTAGSRMSTS